MNPNQPIRSPFGYIATVSTPALDRMGAIWYQEEKERKVKEAAAAKAEQDDYTEKLTNIRAADVGKYKALNNKWATTRREALQLGKKGNPEDYQKKVEEAQILFVKLNQLANNSLAEKKKREKGVDWKDRSDDYDEIMGLYKNTPTDELNKTYKLKNGKEINLSEDAPLYYTPNQMDFTKLGIQGLGGVKKGNLEYKDLGNGQRKKVLPEYYNNPIVIADVVANEMGKVRNGVREVETNLGFLEAQEPKIETDFNAYVNSPEYKKIYGNDAPTFNPPKTRAEKLTQLFAKDLFLKNKPRFIDGEQEVTPEEKLRQEAIKNKRELNEAQKARQDDRDWQKWFYDYKQKDKTPSEVEDNFYSFIGVGGEKKEKYTNLEELARLFSGNPLDITTKNSNKVKFGKTEYLDLTQNFQALEYQKSNSVKDPNDPTKIASAKQDKNFKKILYDPKSGNIIVEYQNTDDKKINLKGVKLKDGTTIGFRQEDEDKNTNTDVILEGGDKLKGLVRYRSNIIKNMAAALDLSPKAKDYLVQIVEQNINKKQTEQSQPAQQPKSKEAPKDKENNKSKSKGKLY